MNGSYQRGEFVEDAAIKPCPKCGRPPTEYVRAGGDWMFVNGSRVFCCHECGLYTELLQRDKAIEKWNEGAYKVKLKPCPFCGDEYPTAEWLDDEVSAVYCSSCHASGPYTKLGLNAAAQMWNAAYFRIKGGRE